MKHSWQAKDVARQICLINFAQQQIMIHPATKLGRQRERATNVSSGMNAASTRLLLYSYGIATMLQPWEGACLRVRLYYSQRR